MSLLQTAECTFCNNDEKALTHVISEILYSIDLARTGSETVSFIREDRYRYKLGSCIQIPNGLTVAGEK